MEDFYFTNFLSGRVIGCSTKRASYCCFCKVISSNYFQKVFGGHYKSQLARMKFCPVLLGRRERYKFIINYICRLHVKSFVPAKWEPSFVLPRSCFAGTKYSHVIAPAHLSGMKKSINMSVRNIP